MTTRGGHQRTYRRRSSLRLKDSECCCRLNVMCKVRSIHSNGSNHVKKSGSSYRLIPLSSCRKFRCNDAHVTVLHSHFVQGQTGSWVYVHPGVVHYILNDVLHNPGVYIHFQYALTCTGIQGRMRMLHRKSDWSLTSDLKFYNGCLQAFYIVKSSVRIFVQPTIKCFLVKLWSRS